MNIPSTTAVKIMCTVNNSLGDVDYDIYEFYINSPPNVGTMNLTIDGLSDITQGSAASSLYHMNLQNWYDNGSDLIQTLKLKIFMFITVPKGVQFQTTYYTLT